MKKTLRIVSAAVVLLFLLIGFSQIGPVNNAEAAAANPSTETLLNGTNGVSGSVSNLSSNDASYRVLRTYSSEFSGGSTSSVSEGQSTYNTNTTYQDKLVLTWNVPTSGYYLVYATAEIKRTSTTAARTTKAQLTIDGVSVAETFVADDTDVDTYRTFVGIDVFNVTSSTTVRLQYATTNTNNTATIKNARITMFYVGSQYQMFEPSGNTTTSASYVDVANLTFTPDITRDWIVFSHSEMVNSATTNNNFANLLIDGSQYAETVHRVANIAHYMPATAMKVFSLSGGSSHTIKIQMKTSAGTLTYRNARIVAIPAVLFNNVRTAISESQSATSTATSASPADKTTLTFSPTSTADYLIIATGEINTTSTTVYGAARLTVDGSTYGDSINDLVNIVQFPSFSISKVLNLSTSSHTLKIQFYVQTSGSATAYIQNARIVAIALPPASKQKVEVEYSGTTSTTTWSQLAWSFDGKPSAQPMDMILQVYNYSSSTYPSSGDGYIAYTATTTSDVTQSQTISTDPARFRDSNGNWKIKITGTATSTDWVDFSVDWVEYNPTDAPTVSCSSATSTTAFGTLTTASVHTSSPNSTTTVSCTYGTGCTLYVKDSGNSTSSGFYKSAVPAYLILSTTTALLAGTEGYGIQATTTSAGSGSTLSLSPTYNKTGNNVGGLSLTDVVLASSTASVTNREVVVTHKAAIGGLTLTGSYADTVTYSCVGN